LADREALPKAGGGELVEPGPLHFRVSTGLKRVLGRELITDDQVAIFELVKNSFDAGARDVFIHFSREAIVIADNGTGMSYDDLRDKWLFVAYSSKRDANRAKGEDDYREQVADRQHYAGSKGIGRFSADRLGQRLLLQSRPEADPNGPVHTLVVDWTRFEQDDAKQFGRVNVAYSSANDFIVPKGMPTLTQGTVVSIDGLAKDWSRTELLKLKAGLAKLINPFGSEVDGFGITIIAPEQDEADRAELERMAKRPTAKQQDTAPAVNGRIGNFIFSALLEKTTSIDVSISDDGSLIESSLTDRGEIVYKIRERNEYPLLAKAGFHCRLYYLNRAAKATFARRMGLPAVQFGSVFLFRNGFRVFPVGEEGDDWFQIDRRKQQGYARFLGTRDVIGRLDVAGEDGDFQEASSRNQGLIDTPAVVQLRQCFRDHCLKRLERYVVPVSWGTSDIDSETLAVLETDSGRARVSAAIADLIGSEDIEVVHYSRRLVDILNERSDQFEASLANLRVIAARTGDDDLLFRINEAEERFAELKRSETEARRIADEERRAKEEAEKRAKSAEAEAASAKLNLNEERKRNLFLASITTLDVQTILDMHHLITIYAADLQQQIENLMLRIGSREEIPRDLIVNGLEPIALLNRKVLSVAKFATKANFRLDSEFIEEDLADYIISYIDGVAKNFLGGRIAIEAFSETKEFRRRFKPIDVAIVIDNLVSNARRARATKIEFTLTQPRKGSLEIVISDDGRGFSPAALEDGRLFEKGFTTTEGSGLGLYHVRQVLDDMGGSIDVSEVHDRGAAFVIRIAA